MPAVESSAFTTWCGSKFISKKDAISASFAVGRSVCAPAQTAFHGSCFSSAVQLRENASSAGRRGSRFQSGSSIHDAGESLPRYSTAGAGGGAGVAGGAGHTGFSTGGQRRGATAPASFSGG